MRSLFVRIFLWFWITLVVAVTVTVLSSPFFTRSRPRLAEWERHSRDAMQNALDGLQMMVEQEGLDRIDELDRRARRGRGSRGRADGPPGGGGPRAHMGFAVYDASGLELVGRDAPPELAQLASRAAKSGAELVERSGALHLAARPVTSPEGQSVILATAARRPPNLVDLIEPEALAVRLGILTLVAAGLVWLLARHLAGPVGALRVATQDIAGGDLSARVGDRVGRRRDEIGDLARDFDSMAERIEALVENQRRLLRDVSHELRSPLARLAVAMELGRKRSGDGATALFDRMERETGALDELIGRLLELARLEGDPGPSRVVDLTGILETVAADARFEAAGRGVQVVASIQAGLEVQGVEWALRSAVENVLRNAIRHAPDGSVVHLGAARAGTHARILVRDAGEGVPVEHLERIFEPFHRVDEAREHDSGGVGLGLAIAARAVRAHRGAISARNVAPTGLEVEVVVPA